MKCLTLGGLDVSPQLERLGLKSEVGFFDNVVAPTRSVARLLDERLGDVFERERLEIVTPAFDLYDEKYDATLAGVYETHVTIYENLCRIVGKYAHRRWTFRDAMSDRKPVVLFHEPPGETDLHSYFDVLAAVRRWRKDAPYHLVMVTLPGDVPADQENVSFYPRPADGDPSAFWDAMAADLRARGKITNDRTPEE